MQNMDKVSFLFLILVPDHRGKEAFLLILVVTKNAGLLFFIVSPNKCYFLIGFIPNKTIAGFF